MSKQYLSYEARALRASSFRFLSREAHILIYLKEYGLASMKQVQLATGLSTRGFYLIVKKLELHKLLCVTDASDDKRKRLLSLTPEGLDGVAKMPISS